MVPNVGRGVEELELSHAAVGVQNGAGVLKAVQKTIWQVFPFKLDITLR